MKRGSYLSVAALCATVAVAAMTGCDRSPAATPPPDARPLVVCTTTMIADLAQRVGGERVRVVGIMPPATDPHIYEPTPDDGVLFGKAAVVLYNGLHLEGKMLHTIENAGARAVALAEDARIKTRASASADGATDPHCWWDARLFAVYAERARDALIQADAGGEPGFRDRCAAYVAELLAVDAEIRRDVERIPPESRYLITSHDAFYYFGAAYGLEVDAVLGISTDASVRALRAEELARTVIARKIPAIFHETSVSASLNRMIDKVVELCESRGYRVRVAPEPLYSDSLGPTGTPAATYVGALRENARIILTALVPTDAPKTAASRPRNGE